MDSQESSVFSGFSVDCQESNCLPWFSAANKESTNLRDALWIAKNTPVIGGCSVDSQKIHQSSLGPLWMAWNPPVFAWCSVDSHEITNSLDTLWIAKDPRPLHVRRLKVQITFRIRAVWSVDKLGPNTSQCASSEDPDHPAHLSSLIRVFAGCYMDILLRLKTRSGCADAKADLTLHWAHKSESTFPCVTLHISLLFIYTQTAFSHSLVSGHNGRELKILYPGSSFS